MGRASAFGEFVNVVFEEDSFSIIGSLSVELSVLRNYYEEESGLKAVG